MYFASPNKQRFQSLFKTGKAAQICYPQYTRDEMIAVASFLMPDIDPLIRLKKVDKIIFYFGGCVRALCSDDCFFDSLRVSQNQHIEELITANNIQSIHSAKRLPALSHTLVRLYPRDDHFLCNKWLSTYVEHEVVKRLNMCNLMNVRKLYKFSSILNEFETLCHHMIPRGGPFRARCLHTGDTKTLQLPALSGIKEFHTFEHISKSKSEGKDIDKIYWIPSNPNFPTVDAMSSHREEPSTNSTVSFFFDSFQYTTAATHPLNLPGAWSLVKSLKIVETAGNIVGRKPKRIHRFFIVVPPHIFEANYKKPQSYTSKTAVYNETDTTTVLEKTIEQWVITSSDFSKSLECT